MKIVIPILFLVFATVPLAIPADDTGYLPIAQIWAPYIYQDTAVDILDGRLGDFIACWDYDDTEPTNNWEHITSSPLSANVYYAVIESVSHYFISYFFYHPRDWGEAKSGNDPVIFHEHDLEGVTICVAKPGTDVSDFVFMYTQAHKASYYFTNGPANVVVDCTDEIFCALHNTDHLDNLHGNSHSDCTESHRAYFVDSHPAVFIEARAHGVGQIRRALNQSLAGDISIEGVDYEFHGGDGIIYIPSPTNASEVPVDSGGVSEVEYALIPFYNHMWANRGSDSNLFDDHQGITTNRGVYMDNMGYEFSAGGSIGPGAHPPWVWPELNNCDCPDACRLSPECLGDYFLDPAEFVSAHLSNLPELEDWQFYTYVSNVYLVGDNSISLSVAGSVTAGEALEINWAYSEPTSGTGMANDAELYLQYYGGSIHIATVPLSAGAWVWDPVPVFSMPGPYYLEMICQSEIGSWLQVRDKLSICQSGSATIDAIQRYDPDTGNPASPHLGCPVTVEGRIFVVNGTYNGGTHYILDDNGNGIYFWLLSAFPLSYGDRVQVTGYIESYAGELGFTSDGGTYPDPLVTFLANDVEPTPEVMSIAEVLYGVGGEDGYENVGKFVYVTGTVATPPGAAYNHQFTIHNGLGDTLVVYIDGSTLIDDADVSVGDIYRITSPVVKYNELIELKPRMQSDLLEEPGPHIYDFDCSSWVPMASDAITVTARIEDALMVASASLYYRDDPGDSAGVFSHVSMSNIVGNTWSGNIPAPHNERQVDIYIAASNGTNTAYYPDTAPIGWKEIAIGITPIYDVQYVDPNNPVQDSPLSGSVCNLSGIVTVGTGDAGAAGKFIIQDAPGAFSGILVYESSAGNYVQAGDEINVGGYIVEYYGLTGIYPHNASAIEFISYLNELPAATQIHCGILSDDTLTDGSGVLGEAYESVWVTTFASTVVDTAGFNPYSFFRISDMPGDTLVVDAIVDLNCALQLGDVICVTGFMDYSFNQFELVPIQDEGIVDASETSVGDDLSQDLPVSGFSRIAPNPFNPKTEISFVLIHDNPVQLNIYNMRGELVRKLIDGQLKGGEHIVCWDGNDNAGFVVSSGAYFARLHISNEVLQVQKVMLVR